MLVDLLINGTQLAQERATQALWELVNLNSTAHDSIAKAGAPDRLVALLKTGIPAAKDYALWSLSLSIDADNQATVLECGGAQPLIDQLADPRTLTQQQAAAALAKLARDNDETRGAITQLGGVIPLIKLLSLSAEAAAKLEAKAKAKAETAAAAGAAAAAEAAAVASLGGAAGGGGSGGSSSSEDGGGGGAAGGGPASPSMKSAAVNAAAAAERFAAEPKQPHADHPNAIVVTDHEGNPMLGPDGRPVLAWNVVHQNAADALANLAAEPAARDEIVGAGGIPALVLLLEADGRNTKQFAATALARLSNEHEETQLAVARAGAIASLVALLDGTEGPEAQEASAGAILALAESPQNRMTITDSGGIGFLVMLLGSDNKNARDHAEGALVRLSIEDANRVQIIKKLVNMLQDPGAGGQEQAAAALANLARESEDNRKSIVDANGIVPLLDILESASPKAKENAVAAIKELCRNSKNNQFLIAKSGGIARLVGVLSGFSANTMKESTLVQLCTLAASAIKEMAKDNRSNQDAITEAGAIPPLVAMLTSPAAQMQANAAGALANLAHHHSDNQGAIARTGAVAPLCSLMKEGSDETKDESAWAIWSLATNHSGNKDTIAKLGGIDPLLGLLVTGTTERSQECVAGALAALASKHGDNRGVIAKRLVGLLGSSAVRTPDRAERVLMTCASFTSDSAANQVSIAKLGGIPPLISWLAKDALSNLPNDAGSKNMQRRVQSQAARAMLCLAADNTTTQGLIAKSDGIPPLIALVKKSSTEAQRHAACALWHLASISENKTEIVSAGGVKPLISMLAADDETAPELAAIILVRLARGNDVVASEIADKGGVLPLVKLLTTGSSGAQLQAASVLAELALVSKNRDSIANAGGITPTIKLLTSPTPGTPETAARVLAHLAHKDVPKKLQPGEEPSPRGEDEVRGSAERRAQINIAGGIRRLIAILDGTGVVEPKDLVGKGAARSKLLAAAATMVMDALGQGGQGPSAGRIGELGLKEEPGLRVGVKEQVAITLADLAHDNHEMQEVIIQAGGVPPLLAFIRMGSQIGQEHAARAIWHLAALTEAQMDLVGAGAIPDLVQLLKTGSPKAQEMAAAGISDLALGAVQERLAREPERKGTAPPAPPAAAPAAATPPATATGDSEEGASTTSGGSSSTAKGEGEGKGKGQSKGEGDDGGGDGGGEASGSGEDGDGSPGRELNRSDRLVMIAEAGGLMPLVALLSPTATAQARENAACALWHLALEETNQVNIAKCNGIQPLTLILDDGTEQAHKHAAAALARLAIGNPENQAQIAKHCVALLGNPSNGAQQRASQALGAMAADNPGSPVVIVNAGAISPLVTLLTTGAPEVKEEAAASLSTLSFNSPSTQLAIASGLVVLVGTGAAEAMEHVTQLLLRLAHDPENCVAIAKAGAIPRLVVQLRGGGRTSVKGQELAAAVLSYLAALDECVKSITTANGVRPLVAMLTSGTQAAQAHAAAVIGYVARASAKNQKQIISEGGINPLVVLLSKENRAKTKAEAAGALLALSSGHPETQKMVADNGAIKPLVALLNEEDDYARIKAAGAIAALCHGSSENQDAVERNKGIGRLVALLKVSADHGEVAAEAAAALAVLANGNVKNQDKVAAAGGVEPLVELLHVDGSEHAKEEAASALWSLSSKNYANQVAIADAGGIAKLVSVLGLASVRAQDQASGALAALALDNVKNEQSIAQLLVGFLGLDDRQAGAKAARAISRLARAHVSNQRSIAQAGGVVLLVSKLDMAEGGVGVDLKSLSAAQQAAALEAAMVQKELASAIWSMAHESADNQRGIDKAGGIAPLITLLEGHPEVHRDVAGALWSLAADTDNQTTIAQKGGIPPLVELLKVGSLGVHETAAGALDALAQTAHNRVLIADAGGIPLLVALFDGGSLEAIEQASSALQKLVQQNEVNQKDVVNEAVSMLKNGSAEAQEHVTALLRNLAQDPENRASIAKAGAVPELVRQLEMGSEKAMGMAAGGLALIALKSAEFRATVTNELVKLLGSNKEAVRQRASEALTDMAADEGGGGRKGTTSVANGVPLVNLLKDGLKDGRVEAQEYALRSLLSVSDAAAKQKIVDAGCIGALIASLVSGQLSAIAQEHAAAVISGLAPLAANAAAIRNAKGIDPLVVLLSKGTADAKAHAATTLAQMARRAGASSEIAEAGAVSAFIGWLHDPSLGPPEVAARALSEIAEGNPDTQLQIAEEGAISPLVQMVGAWPTIEAPPSAEALAAAAEAKDKAEREAEEERLAEEERERAKSVAAKKSAVAAAAAQPPSSTAGGEKPATTPSAAPTGGVVEASAPDADAAAAAGDVAPTAAEVASEDKAKLEAGATSSDADAALSAAVGVDANDTAPAPTADTEAAEAPASAEAKPMPPPAAAPVGAQTPAGLRRSSTATRLGARRGSGDEASNLNGSGAPAEAPAAEPPSKSARGRTAAADAANARAARKAVESAIKVANVAAGALATLAKDNIVNQMMITEEGGIQPLVDLLKTKADSYENPTKALWHLATTEDNQTAIAKAGGIAPLVSLLTSPKEMTAQYASAALRTLAREHPENQIALAKAGAIAPLVDLLGSDSQETQEHSVGALLHLASQDVASRNAVVLKLVAVLNLRNAAAQMKAAEALAVLAGRSDENRKAITAANAIEPLVRLLGDGRRVRAKTPQERAAAVLSNLARSGDNKKAIVEAGSVAPLVAMLSSDAPEAQTHAAAALAHLVALGSNRPVITGAGAIQPLVALLGSPSVDAQKHASGALYHLASSADNKVQMANTGAIPLLVTVLESRSSEAREHAAGVVSALARTQGGNKKALFNAGAVRPLVFLLSDLKPMTQRHAACALWGLCDGKDGVYDKHIAEAGAIPLLIAMLQNDDIETRGFAVACLKCICNDSSAHSAILESGGAELLQALSYGPQTWLRTQVVEMLKLLGTEVPDPDNPPPEVLKQLSLAPAASQTQSMASDGGADNASVTGSISGAGSGHTGRISITARSRLSTRTPRAGLPPGMSMGPGGMVSSRPLTGTARMKFHFFTFQIHGTTGVDHRSDDW